MHSSLLDTEFSSGLCAFGTLDIRSHKCFFVDQILASLQFTVYTCGV